MNNLKKCLHSYGSGITIKSFFHICKNACIELPKTKKATQIKPIIKTELKPNIWSSNQRIRRQYDENIINPLTQSEQRNLRKYYELGQITDPCTVLTIPLLLNSTDITTAYGNCKTGKAFNDIIIQGYKFKCGKVFDVLFSANGELIRLGEQFETVNRLAMFFNKCLKPAIFDYNPCWVHDDKRFMKINT